MALSNISTYKYWFMFLSNFFFHTKSFLYYVSQGLIFLHLFFYFYDYNFLFSPFFFFLFPFSLLPLFLWFCINVVYLSEKRKRVELNVSFKTYNLFLKSLTWFGLSGRVFGAIQLYFTFIILLIVCVYTSVELSRGKNQTSKSSFLSFLSSADTWLPMELWGPLQTMS